MVDEDLRQRLLASLIHDEWHPEPPATSWHRRTVDDAAVPRFTWGLREHVLQALPRNEAVVEVQTRLARLFPHLRIFHLPTELMAPGKRDCDGGVPGEPFSEQQEMGSSTASLHQCGNAAGGDHTDHVSTGSIDGSRSADSGAVPATSGEPQSNVHGPDAALPSRLSVPDRKDGSGCAADEATAECNCFVGNAAVHGDLYQWHVDADPMNIPEDSAWVQQFGLYANRVRSSSVLAWLKHEGMSLWRMAGLSVQEPGKPRLISMLVYLNSQWALGDDGETLLLDAPSETAVAVRPKPGRVLLLDQDIMHRVSAPAASTGRPRYSLVWKLAVLDQAHPERTPSIALHGANGQVASFGSAMKMKVAQARLVQRETDAEL